MRTKIEIDDALLAETMALTGLQSKREAMEKSLRLLVRRRGQTDALAALQGLGWDGALDEMRQGRQAAI